MGRRTKAPTIDFIRLERREQCSLIFPLLAAELLLAGLLILAAAHHRPWGALLVLFVMAASALIIGGSFAVPQVMDDSLLRLLQQNHGRVDVQELRRLYSGPKRWTGSTTDQSLGLLSACIDRLEKKKLVKADGHFVHLLYKRNHPLEAVASRRLR